MGELIKYYILGKVISAKEFEELSKAFNSITLTLREINYPEKKTKFTLMANSLEAVPDDI